MKKLRVFIARLKNNSLKIQNLDEVQTIRQLNDEKTTQRRTIQFKDCEMYEDKFVKQHFNFVRDFIIAFQMMSKDFVTKNRKIVYAMQYLVDESKKS